MQPNSGIANKQTLTLSNGNMEIKKTIERANQDFGVCIAFKSERKV
jgi:hypothetical protein